MFRSDAGPSINRNRPGHGVKVESETKTSVETLTKSRRERRGDENKQWELGNVAGARTFDRDPSFHDLQRLYQHPSILAALWRWSELHQNGQAGAVSSAELESYVSAGPACRRLERLRRKTVSLTRRKNRWYYSIYFNGQRYRGPCRTSKEREARESNR